MNQNEQQVQPTEQQPTPELEEAQRQAAAMQEELKKQAAQGAATEFVKSAAVREVNRAVSQILPDEVNRIRWAGLKGIPVVGDIVDWADRLFQLKRLFK